MSREPKPTIVDHNIQRDILRTLVHAGSARFSELKPKRVESNLFMYHLKQMIKSDIIEKDGINYSLTTDGRMYIDRANLDDLFFRVQPKIVNILAIKSGKGNWLLLERLHEPHMNRVGFPSGKLHYGETLEEAAERELMEKAGLTGIKLKLAGNVAMRFTAENSEDVINHTIGYVFVATLSDEPEIKNLSEHWRSFWGEEKHLLSGNIFKGHPDILELIASGRPFVKSLNYISDY